MLLAIDHHYGTEYLCLYDTKTNRILSHHEFQGIINYIGWINPQMAVIGTNRDRAIDVTSHWYSLILPADRIEPTKAVIGHAGYPILPGAWEYGE